MRKKDNLKFDIVIRQNGVKILKGKSLNMAQMNAQIERVVSKKINAPLFGSIVTSITCFGLFYHVIATMGVA